ncbi:MAG TPA: GTPase ObgE [Candidatus Izemoplasmatales bacterium]|nr:GTPase ObgE [Candidatus Izemoplasmatales bacterium]
MFVDQVEITVKSGKGGDGIIAWRREKYVPFGGPFGGDGGKGGSVILQADEGLSTLLDLRYRRKIIAEAGKNGGQKNMHGSDADDIIVPVPVGTIVFDAETGRMICDLTEHNQTFVVAKGGKGGRGNTHFATPRNQAPEIQENGEPGITLHLRMELKLLADVGLIGFPSVGKSTFISAVSAAKPKIGAYPFTTIVPNLGVVDVEGVKSFVMADLPGILEGASRGVGLGLQFLRHIERTRVLIHVLDLSDNGRDPYEDYLAVNRELAEYQMRLTKRPQILVANKMDADGAETRLDNLRKRLEADVEVFPVSALTRSGLKPVLQKAAELLEKTPLFDIYEEEKAHENDSTYFGLESQDPGFAVRKLKEGNYEAFGPKIDRLIEQTLFGNEESIRRLSRSLRVMGVDDALRRAGVQNGDMVRIGDYEFEFVD